jgi:hypothetical protein
MGTRERTFDGGLACSLNLDVEVAVNWCHRFQSYLCKLERVGGSVSKAREVSVDLEVEVRHHFSRESAIHACDLESAMGLYVSQAYGIIGVGCGLLESEYVFPCIKDPKLSKVKLPLPGLIDISFDQIGVLIQVTSTP